jgi:hypothetical protein
MMDLANRNDSSSAKYEDQYQSRHEKEDGAQKE